MIYLDHAATTPLDPRVRERMLPWLDCANPSSQHALGRAARMAIDEAREAVAPAMGCLPGEVLFTSSGTEAMVTAILGIARANTTDRDTVVIGAAEHECALACVDPLRELGYKVELAAATSTGALDVQQLTVSDDTLMVVAMHANNETGAITDTGAVSETCREFGALFVCDAVQTFGKLPLPDADCLAVSGHKVYGPKGVGALRLRAGLKPKPLIVGGGQEREMRSGTENVAGIVGFAEAVRLLEEPSAEGSCRDVFVEEVRRLVPSAVFTAIDCACLPGHAHLRVPGVSAEVALIVLDRLGVAASSGAACSSGSIEPSHVLLAAGHDGAKAKEGLRFTFGRQSIVEKAREAARLLARTAADI